MAALAAGLGAGFAYIGCVLCCKGMDHCQKKRMEAHQQDDVYNISSRVQGQEQRQWANHDAHLSIEHITIMNQMNKPDYNDAPPTYEEAMRIAAMNSVSRQGSISTVIVVAPKPSTH